MRLEESWLRQLLEWSKDKSFTEAPKIHPTLPEYLLTARLDGKEKQLSPVYVKKVVGAANRFFSWIKSHKKGYGAISQGWIDTLKPPRMTIEPKEHEAVTLEEIKAMARAPVYTMRDKRIRAAAVFLFLSGIRIGAFVTLPISAVDLDTLTVRQWPKLGVHTKFHKHATTYLLNIPELLEVVKEWDKQVRKVSAGIGFWFANISPETGEIDTNIVKVGEYRPSRARKDLHEWLKKVGLPYHSPHKFRHGFAVFSITECKRRKNS